MVLSYHPLYTNERTYMTTVLTLEPLDFNVLGNTLKLQLRGKPCKGNTVIKVDYPASFAPKSIDLGVAALHDALRKVTGPKLVFAHSQGAQVVSRWLRKYTNTFEAPPPSEVSFLLIGNPLRKFGGYIIGKPEVGGQTGLPTLNNTPYAVTDITMQYDGWSDMPTKPGKWALLNASQGKNKRHCYGYLTADMDDPKRKVYQENTTTYVMLPGKPNIPVPQAWIESSYARPEK